MTDPFDLLRPEVREDVIEISRWMFGDGHWQRVRAELLRLAKAEAELAALKARIAEAPVGVFGLCYNGHEPGFLGFPQAIDNLPRENMLGKRLRLLVEE